MSLAPNLVFYICLWYAGMLLIDWQVDWTLRALSNSSPHSPFPVMWIVSDRPLFLYYVNLAPGEYESNCNGSGKGQMRILTNRD